jgi:hypothetical protein
MMDVSKQQDVMTGGFSTKNGKPVGVGAVPMARTSPYLHHLQLQAVSTNSLSPGSISI